MKTIVQSLIKNQYSLYPSVNDPGAPSSPHAIKEFVRSRVQDLLSGMSFLRGPLDAKVCSHYSLLS